MVSVTHAVGGSPVFGNLLVMLWLVLNLLVLIAVIVLAVWYLILQDRHRRQLLGKMDALIQALQQKNGGE